LRLRELVYPTAQDDVRVAEYAGVDGIHEPVTLKR
jgi:hypothetical protein